MARRLILRRDAERDASRAAAWYQSRQAGLEDAYLNELDRVLRQICETPEAFPLVLGATRRALLRRFPYAVFFRLGEGFVEVVAVFHMRRSPVRWRVRDPAPTYRLGESPDPCSGLRSAGAPVTAGPADCAPPAPPC